MNLHPHFSLCAGIILASLAGLAQAAPPADLQIPKLAPASMPKTGTINERFQSFNVEMVEVTGGRFWKPYNSEVDALLRAPTAAGPVGMDPALYQQRPAIDLSNPRLRKLAAALGPAYIRVSGTWANITYFQTNDAITPVKPPAGFTGVLTHPQWKGVVDFSRAVNARIITSFATSTGTRNAAGTWTATQASQFLEYTKSIGGSVAAAEFMNEPTFAEMGGAPKGYNAAAYGRDLAVFLPFARKAAPDMLILGPGSVGEGVPLAPEGAISATIKTEDLLKTTGPVFDAFSYHFYGGVSKRCASVAPGSGVKPDEALSAEWLSRTGRVEAFYAALRDRFLPGKPLWVTETADAACGGNPWGSTFLDSFRYIDQLGRLAASQVQVVAHNTLASSDYGLLDENNFTPRPNYWSALLWRRLMGTTVLNPGPSPVPSVHLYAHCLPGHAGGVTVLAINTSHASQAIQLPMDSDLYALTAHSLQDPHVLLNGTELALGPNDALPEITGVRTRAGLLTLAPTSISYLAIPGADNAACR